MLYSTERKFNPIQVNKNKRWGTDTEPVIQTFNAIIGHSGILICYTMLFPALKLKLIFNGKEPNSAYILRKLMKTSRKHCNCRKMWKITCNSSKVISLCLFGLVHRLHPFVQFWRVQTKLFYFQSLVCTDLRI